MVRTFIFTISLLLILSGIPHRLLALDDYSLVQSVILRVFLTVQYCHCIEMTRELCGLELMMG